MTGKPTASVPNASHTLGAVGEGLAFHYLTRHGYKVLLRNYESPMGEIDMIAKQNGDLVFVEVKTRSSDAYGVPAEAVTYLKQRQIVKSALYYLKRYGVQGRCCRFDVVSVLLPPEKEPVIEIIVNAFGENG